MWPDQDKPEHEFNSKVPTVEGGVNARTAALLSVVPPPF